MASDYGWTDYKIKTPYKNRLQNKDILLANSKYHAVMKSIDLDEIETLYAVGREIEHDISDLTNEITKVMFAQRESITDNLERISTVFNLVAKKKYARALEASGFSSLQEFVETERSVVSVSVNTLGTDITRYKSLKDVNGVLIVRLDDTIKAVEKTIKILEESNRGHEDKFRLEIVPLSNRLAQLHEIRTQIEVQGVRIDEFIARLKNDIEVCSNAGLSYLSQICLLENDASIEASSAWTGISPDATFLEEKRAETSENQSVPVKIAHGVNISTTPIIIISSIASLVLAIKPLLIFVPAAIVANIFTQGKGAADTVGLWTLLWNNPREAKTNRYTAIVEYKSNLHMMMFKGVSKNQKILYSDSSNKDNKDFQELCRCGFLSEVAPFGLKMPFKTWHGTPMRTNAVFVGGIFDEIWEEIVENPERFMKKGISPNGYIERHNAIFLFEQLGIFKVKSKEGGKNEYSGYEDFFPGPTFKRYEMARKYYDAKRGYGELKSEISKLKKNLWTKNHKRVTDLI